MKTTSIRLIIADDHEIYRDGIITLLSKLEDIEVVAEASDGGQLVQLAEKHLPDVILADIHMPVMNGIEATRIITEKFPAVAIIALSMTGNAYMISDMIHAGANGYLLKNALKEEIIRRIRAASKNQVYFCSGASQNMTAPLTSLSFKTGRPARNFIKNLRFNRREKEIIRLICSGLSGLEISKKLFLSPKTIENYRSRLLQKTGCKNAAEFGFFVSQNNLHSI